MNGFSRRAPVEAIVSSWIWQQPEWPQFCCNSSALEPLLVNALATRQELLSSWAVEVSNDLRYARLTEVKTLLGDPTKATDKLVWSPPPMLGPCAHDQPGCALAAALQ